MNKKTTRKNENKEFTLVTYSFFILFLVLIAYFSFFIIFKSETAINNPYNKRQDTFEKYIVRGPIYSADGKLLAETKVAEDGKEERSYPYANLFAHAIGYAKMEKQE